MPGVRVPLLLLLACSSAVCAAEARYFRIEVVERDAGSPIAGARLETTGRIPFVSDQNGLVAFYEPGQMGQPVFFTPTRSGYEHPADFIGIRGKALDAVEGGVGRIELVRAPGVDAGPVPIVNDRDTRRLGDGGFVPGPAQLFALRIVDAQTGRGVPLVFVRGLVSDSAGRIAWEDPDGQPTPITLSSHGYRTRTTTVNPKAAMAETVTLERLQIAERLYRVTGGGIYRDTVLLGLPAPTVNPVLSGKVIGQDSVLSTVYRGKPFYVWGDTNRVAYPLGNFASSAAIGSGFDADRGVDLTYFVDADGFSKRMAPMAGPGLVWLAGLSTVRSEDGGEALFATYGIYPGLAAPTQTGIVRFDDATEEFVKVLQTDAGPRPEGHALVWDGGLIFSNGVRIPATAAAMTDRTQWAVLPKLSLDGGIAFDFSTGLPVTLHENDTIAWNAHRRRFIRFASEAFGGPSFLGEQYYLEADTPMGPWVWATKVITHDNYTLYNPRHHPFFDDGSKVYVEGTYTASFADDPPVTPRCDYNQVMFRVDLEDPRLAMPVPLYSVVEGQRIRIVLATQRAPTDNAAPYGMALDRPRPGAVPVSVRSVCNATYTTALDAGTPPVFWAMPRGTRALLSAGLTVPFDDDGAVGWILPTRNYNPAEWQAPYGVAVPDVCAPLIGTPEIKAIAWGLAEPVTYAWTTPKGPMTGATVKLSLPNGVHPVSVVATGADGVAARANGVLEVGRTTTTPPPRPCGCGCSTAEGWLAFLALLAVARRRKEVR